MYLVVNEFGEKNGIPFDYILEDDIILTPDHRVEGNRYFFAYEEKDGCVVCEWYVPISVLSQNKKTIVGFNKFCDICIKNGKLPSYIPKSLHEFVRSVINKNFPFAENLTKWNKDFIALEKIYFKQNFTGWNVRYKNYYIDVNLNLNRICIIDGAKQIINVNY